MTQIATKFVKWDIPELATLQDSKVYKLRVHLNNGGKLNREEKNWITRNVWESIYFKRGIALSNSNKRPVSPVFFLYLFPIYSQIWNN